jgi:hypothetical protein
MLINCLVSYFGRDSNTLVANDLVIVFSKLLEINHLKPHMMEVSDYLSSQLDGLDLRPRLVSFHCLIGQIDDSISSANIISNDDYRKTQEKYGQYKLIDFTKTANEILYWLSFKNNCPKLILGDTTNLFIVQELVSLSLGSVSLQSDNNFLSITTEHNSHIFSSKITFDRSFHPTISPRSSQEAILQNSSQHLSKPQIGILFDMEEFSIDLRPLTSLAINRVDLYRLFQSNSLAAHVKDLAKF